MKKLSVIIPAYNAERFIEKQLDELILQMQGCENDCEIIVVNDGSKDKTKEIAAEKALEHSFITIISQNNKGECGARNTGIKYASGSYVFFLDADDFIEPGTVRFYLESIDNASEDIDLFCYSYKSVDYDTNRTLAKYSLKRFDKKTLEKDFFLKNYYGKHLSCLICSLVIKRQVLLESGIYFTEGVRIGGDILFQLHLFSAVRKVFCRDRICFIYRIRNDSVMQGYKTYQKLQFHTIELFQQFFGNTSCLLINHHYINFFISVHYLYNLYLYLKSDTKDATINEMFIRNKCLLVNPIFGVNNFRFVLMIAIFRVIPLSLLFRIYHKKESDKEL